MEVLFKEPVLPPESAVAKPDYLYRQGVGLMITNKDGLIFVGKRIDNNSDSWQMPQGGLEFGEDEERGALRELEEETGIDSKDVQIVIKSRRYYYYNLPYRLQKKFWGGKYLGQKQRWYLLKFLGNDRNIDIHTESPEFSDWRWVSRDELIKLIVPFKRPLYVALTREFQNYLQS